MPNPPELAGTPGGASRPGSLRVPLLALAGVVLLAVWLARLGSAYASPTYDEPLHLAASHVAAHRFDLRVNPEHPPLWKVLAGLANAEADLPLDTGSTLYRRVESEPRAHWQWAATALYRPAVPLDVDGLVASARDVTLAWGVGLVLLTAGLAWRVTDRGGAWVALGAGALLAFDPTFLAHTALITNDVPFAVATVLFTLALLACWRRAGVGPVVALGVAAALGALVKFSVVAFVPMAVAVLAVRALGRGDWAYAGGMATTRGKRLGVACAVMAVSGLVSYAGIWAGYGFRYSAAPRDVEAPLTASMEFELAEIAKARGSTTGDPGTAARLVATLSRSRALPEAMCRGLLTQWRIAQRSRGFVLGENRNPAPMYAMPLSYALKTPTATLAVLALAGGVAAFTMTRRRQGRDDRMETGASMMLPLAVAVGAFMVVALLSGRARGVRYLLPVIPLVYVLAMAVLARVRWSRVVVPVAIVLVGVETYLATPRFISFFNVPSRVLGPPETLLGDSNLDWGQGLRELAGWRRANPQVTTVYLAYFGMADPDRYIPGAIPAPPGYLLTQRLARVPAPSPGAVLVVSATILQGTYLTDEQRAIYEPFRQRTPLVRLAGGSLLVFDLSGR